VFWNEGVQRDREVTANRPDIIIKNTKVKTCVLIEVAIPADRIGTQKEAEKKLKYNGLCVEIHRKWNMNCMVIPVITGATAMVTKCLKKIWKPYQENIQLIHYKIQLYLEHHT